MLVILVSLADDGYTVSCSIDFIDLMEWNRFGFFLNQMTQLMISGAFLKLIY